MVRSGKGGLQCSPPPVQGRVVGGRGEDKGERTSTTSYFLAYKNNIKLCLFLPQQNVTMQVQASQATFHW